MTLQKSYRLVDTKQESRYYGCNTRILFIPILPQPIRGYQSLAAGHE